ncbi:gamma-glutamylcyclotransferase family protein [Synechocystis sp. PCC 7509]|uniref:gamma-glutamylcyclotransferase family protein n=1 Tax=Synechocystis sp. PCC 7509 TaxID=927677 RepID=UPI0002AC3543|nr:gamma-glutamylcyclotransferase [Synechocystis sp. PCC 7509]
MLKVFVYGTLKPGERNYHLFGAAKVIEVQQAIAYGKLYNLPMGYPAAIFPESYLVRGYLLTFLQRAFLQALDELEDYDPSQPTSQNLYQRHQIEVYKYNKESLGKAWTYSMNQQQINGYGGIFISDGWWESKK